MGTNGIDVKEEENIKLIKSIFGADVPDFNIKSALLKCNNNPGAAINEFLDKPLLLSPDFYVKKTVTSTGARVSAQMKQENDGDSEEMKPLLGLKVEGKEKGDLEMGHECTKDVQRDVAEKVCCNDGGESECKPMVKVKEEPDVKMSDGECRSQVKEEMNVERSIVVKEEMKEPIMVEPLASCAAVNPKRSMYDRLRPPSVKKQKVEDNRVLSTVLIEDADFPEEDDWLLVGRNAITGLSTTRGRKLENNEIVHLAFPGRDTKPRCNSPFIRSKTVAAMSEIVRFSTTRSGEIGRLPMEWAKCLIPLVNSSKVKVLCWCIAAPSNLQLMQEILLYARLLYV